MIASAVNRAMFCRVQPRCVARLLAVTMSSATLRTLVALRCRTSCVITSVIADPQIRNGCGFATVRSGIATANYARANTFKHRRRAVPRSLPCSVGPGRPMRGCWSSRATQSRTRPHRRDTLVAIVDGAVVVGHSQPRLLGRTSLSIRNSSIHCPQRHDITRWSFDNGP